jgi:hypothetical protein
MAKYAVLYTEQEYSHDDYLYDTHNATTIYKYKDFDTLDQLGEWYKKNYNFKSNLRIIEYNELQPQLNFAVNTRG